MSNRMLVMPTDSHITEERRIEEKMKRGVGILKELTSDLDQQLFDGNWHDAGTTANQIGIITDSMVKLEYRRIDVKSINEQFARIQAHMDRIEATEEQE